MSRRRVLFPLLARTGAVVAAVAAAVFLLLGGDDSAAPSRASVPVVLSADELSSFVESRNLAVSWAGDLPSRRLELTTTDEGTFLRYLPPDAVAGDDRPALTVATYPLAGAYTTAMRRSQGAGMRSRRAGDRIAVWSRERPTSIYLADRGVPQLVEVYAPTASEARTVALSRRVRPVR